MVIFSSLCLALGLFSRSLQWALALAAGLFVFFYLLVFFVGPDGVSVRMPTGLHAVVPVVIGFSVRWFLIRVAVFFGDADQGKGV